MQYSYHIAHVLQVFGSVALCTFKLHLAAIHLADQVRACGPSFFCLEYWVERMVQLYKRLIKYRSTACPEKVFVNDHLVQTACLRILISSGGGALQSLTQAISEAQIKRVKRKGRSRAHAADDCMLGAPQSLAQVEKEEVIPPDAGANGKELTGLPYLLVSETDLSEMGWPTYGHLPTTRARGWAVMRGLGVEACGRPGEQGVQIKLHKYLRANLPVGDAASCLQLKTQFRKDNSFAYIEYTAADPDGGLLRYIAQFKYFVMAERIKTVHRSVFEAEKHSAKPLKLGVVNLFHCQVIEAAWIRQRDDAVGRTSEFMAVTDLSTDSRAFAGAWVVNLATVRVQVVPTREVNGHSIRYFMVADKASGRTGSMRAL